MIAKYNQCSQVMDLKPGLLSRIRHFTHATEMLTYCYIEESGIFCCMSGASYFPPLTPKLLIMKVQVFDFLMF